MFRFATALLPAGGAAEPDLADLSRRESELALPFCRAELLRPEEIFRPGFGAAEFSRGKGSRYRMRMTLIFIARKSQLPSNLTSEQKREKIGMKIGIIRVSKALQNDLQTFDSLQTDSENSVRRFEKGK